MGSDVGDYISSPSLLRRRIWWDPVASASIPSVDWVFDGFPLSGYFLDAEGNATWAGAGVGVVEALSSAMGR